MWCFAIAHRSSRTCSTPYTQAASVEGPLNDALRAIYNDGLPLSGYAVELVILAAWMVAGFLLSLRLFRWQ